MVVQPGVSNVSLSSRVQELEKRLASKDWDRSPNGQASFFDLLDNCGRRPIEHHESESLTAAILEESLQVVSSTAIRDRIRQLESLDTVAKCPVLGITGLLNSGKSSLLSCYLSEEGRKRILIGQANDQGTHRFVLWLPEYWRSQEATWNLILEQVRTVFGTDIEYLSQDIDEAFQQYNGHRSMTNSESHVSAEKNESSIDPLCIPLIATDKALDRWNVALMDCPDIQTGLWSSAWSATAHESTSSKRSDASTVEQSISMAIHRSEVLFRAMRLCSAFVVVAQANAIHDNFIDSILRGMQISMPGIDRIFAVNRVPRRYSPSQIAAELSELDQKYQLARCYMAYHFEGPLQRDKLPKPPAGLSMAPDSPLPLFFRVDGEKTPIDTSTLCDEDFLVSIAGQVDSSRLITATRGSLIKQLQQQIKVGWSRIEAEQSSRRDRIARVWQLLAEATFNFSQDSSTSVHDTPKLRLYASKEIIQQVANSLEKTAPWWAYPSRVVVRIAQATKDAVGRATTSVLPSRWLNGKSQEMVDFVQSGMRRGDIGRVVNARTLVHELQSCDYRADIRSAAISDELLTDRCQRIIDRFQTESKARLDDVQLNQLSQQVWDSMGWKQRLWTGLAPASIAFAPLLAVIALPFDFGGSSILVLASMKELLFAGVAGMGLALVNRDNMPKIAEQQVAWQQLCDLFVVGCDELGMLRPDEKQLPSIPWSNTRRPLNRSEVATPSHKPSPLFAAPAQLDQHVWDDCESILRSLVEESAE